MHKINNIIKNQNPEFLPKVAEWHVYGNEQQGRFLTKFPEELLPTYYGTEVTDDIKGNIFKRQLGKKAYELKDHLGNVRVTFSDIKIPKTPPNGTYEVDLLSKSEYYPYGMKINDLSYNAQNIARPRYGYNGTHEQDKELNTDGNYLDFGNFGYDTRVAMRRNQEPLRAKYPHLSGYSAFGSNPIKYSDLDGNNFGIKVDHTNKTIIIVANIFTISDKTTKEAKNAAILWYQKKTNIDGYEVSFLIEVKQNFKDEDQTYTKDEKKGLTIGEATQFDQPQINNVYVGRETSDSKYTNSNDFVGGETQEGFLVWMHANSKYGNLGQYPKFVGHEFGHLFGLNDKILKAANGKPTNIINTFYPGDGGIMQYNGMDLYLPSDNDVRAILNYANCKLFILGNTPNSSQVEILEVKGEAGPDSPIGGK